MSTRLLMMLVSLTSLAALCPTASAQVPKERNSFPATTSSSPCLAFSPDGKILAIPGLEGEIKLLDPATGKERSVLKGHQQGIQAMVFRADGKGLASAGYDNATRLWDVSTGKTSKTFKTHDSFLTNIALSPDGKHLALSGNDGLKLWDTASGKDRLLDKEATHPRILKFSSDGKSVQASGRGDALTNWEVATGKEQASLKVGRDAVMSADGQKLAWATSDMTITVADAATGKPIVTLRGHTNYIHKLGISPNGQTLLSSDSDGTVRIWDLPSGKERGAVRIPGLETLAFSPDGKVLVTAENSLVKLWDMVPGTLPPLPPFVKERTALRHDGNVWSVAFSPDGKMLATGGGDNEREQYRGVSLWDLASGKRTAFIKSSVGPVMVVVFSPDGKLLAWVNEGSEVVTVWDMAGKLKGKLSAHNQEVRTVAFSPDSKTLATGSREGTAKLFDVDTLKPRLTLKGHSSEVRWLAFSPDGKMLATAGYDQVIKLWDTNTGKEGSTLRGHTEQVSRVAFLPDGKTLASMAYKAVKIWDVASGKEKASFPGSWDLHILAVAPDGSSLVVGGPSTTFLLLDPATGKEKAVLKGHENSLWQAVYSPDGKRVAGAGSGDTTARLWDIPPMK